MEDRRCLAWSLAVGVLASGLGLVYCCFHYATRDSQMMSLAGTLLLHGHLRSLYSTLPGLYDLPLSFPFIGLVALVADWLRLGPWSGLVVVPGFCLMGVPALYQVRRLAWDLGLRQRLIALQFAAGLVLFAPLFEWGHPEDLLALAMVIAALRRVIAADHVRACVYLAIAVSFKQWAVLLIPLALLNAPSHLRVRCLVAACALPAALAAVFLAVDFHTAVHAFFQPTTVVSGPGHPSLFGHWLGKHSSQVNRAAVTVVAALLAWRSRRWTREPVRLVATAGLILVIRPLAETSNFSYYWTPGLLLLALALTAGRGRFETGDWVWPTLALVWSLTWSNPLTPTNWWLGEMAILGMFFLTSRRLLSIRRSSPVPADSVPGRPQMAEAAR